MGFSLTSFPVFGTDIDTAFIERSSNMNNSDIQIIREIHEIKSIIKETSSSTLESSNRDVILTLLGISVPVTVAIFLFWLEQYTRRKHTIQSSCDTIL